MNYMKQTTLNYCKLLCYKKKRFITIYIPSFFLKKRFYKAILFKNEENNKLSTIIFVLLTLIYTIMILPLSRPLGKSAACNALKY